MKGVTKKAFEDAQEQFNRYDIKTQTRLQAEMIQAYHDIPNTILLNKTDRKNKEKNIYINIVKREMVKRGKEYLKNR